MQIGEFQFGVPNKNRILIRSIIPGKSGSCFDLSELHFGVSELRNHLEFHVEF